MRKEKEQTISGIKFKATQLGFTDGMEFLTMLIGLSGQLSVILNWIHHPEHLQRSNQKAISQASQFRFDV
jgi:hypothetical protein